MANYKPKIKITFKGESLQAMRAISAAFVDCGKVANIILNAHKQKTLKFTNKDFICVYKGILKTLDSHRYPNKTGNEYHKLMELKILFEQLHVQHIGAVEESLSKQSNVDKHNKKSNADQ